MPSSLPWPEGAPVLPVEPLRPVIERLRSLALRHPEDVTLHAGLVDEDGEQVVSADPPPALAQVLEEFGGIDVRGAAALELVTPERGDVGPYTLLGDPISFWPLHEGEDVAVILTLDETGAPGAVYGIGEDLALTLAARDLHGFLDLYADALEATLSELGERADTARDEAAAELMDAHLLRTLLGEMPPAERLEVPVRPVADAAGPDVAGLDLPAGAVGVADLRDAPREATVPIMDADLPGDPLSAQIAWREKGLLVLLVDAGPTEEAGR